MPHAESSFPPAPLEDVSKYNGNLEEILHCLTNSQTGLLLEAPSPKVRQFALSF